MEAWPAPAYEPGLLNFMGSAEGLRPMRSLISTSILPRSTNRGSRGRAEGHLVVEVQRDEPNEHCPICTVVYVDRSLVPVSRFVRYICVHIFASIFIR